MKLKNDYVKIARELEKPSHSVSTHHPSPSRMDTPHLPTQSSIDNSGTPSQPTPHTITSTTIPSLANNSYINAPCSGGSDSASRSPMLTNEGSNPYVAEFYRKRLEDKNLELNKLKQKLSKIQNDLRLKRSLSKQQIYQNQSMTASISNNSMSGNKQSPLSVKTADIFPQHRRSVSQCKFLI